MTTLISPLLFLAALGFCLFRAWRRNEELWEFFPSFSWSVFMAVPFVLEAHTFLATYTGVQSLGISLVGLALLAADARSATLGARVPRVSRSARGAGWALWLAAGVTVLHGVHLATMETIPLLAHWSQRGDMPKTLLAQHEQRMADYATGTPSSAPTLPPRPDGWSLEALEVYFQYAMALGKGADAEKAAFGKLVLQVGADRARVLAELREKSSKLSGAPPAFIYACQVGLLLAPAVSITLLLARYRLVAAAFLLFSLFYSRATLAKAPLYVELLSCAFIFWVAIPELWRRRATPWIAGAGALAVSALVVFFVVSPFSLFRFRPSPEVAAKVLERGKPLTITLPDRSRLLDDSAELSMPRWQRSINSAVYRAILVPAEVSHFWYVFYPDVFGKHLGFYGLTPASRGQVDFRHPSNELGRWAYTRRFPAHYLDSVNAYSSADADAYARWGIAGIAIVALLLGGLRLTLGWAARSGPFAATAIYATALANLATSLPSASLPAVLVAQGLGSFLVLLLLLRLGEFRGRVADPVLA